MNWHHLWFGYFWPSLQGNGPEALVQTVVYGAIAYAIVPPFRKWVNGHFKRVQETHDSIHAKLDAHHAEHIKLAKEHHAEHMDLAIFHHAKQVGELADRLPKKAVGAKKVTPVRPRKGKD